MLKRIVGISTVVSALLLFLLLQTTTPSTVGPVGLLAVFFLLYISLVGLVAGLAWIFTNGIVAVGKMLAVRRPMSRPKFKQIYYYASVIALAPVMMLAMKSIGSLGLYEVILVLLFIGIALLYVSKRDF